jgi:hypothetical protein
VILAALRINRALLAISDMTHLIFNHVKNKNIKVKKKAFRSLYKVKKKAFSL